MGAILAGGPKAVLSHQSAAALWGLRRSRGDVDVTIPSSRRSRAGITWHVSHLPQDEIGTLSGIPVTSVPRTLLDLAAALSRRSMERAMNEAEIRRYADHLSLPALLDRHPRRRGAAQLRAILAEGDLGSTVTRSELEERFLGFLQDAGLPCPQVNVPMAVRGAFMEVDCLWRPQRVIVELDGRRTHATTAAFESDRARDRVLAAEGWRVVRITWRQLQERADELADDMRSLLVKSERS